MILVFTVSSLLMLSVLLYGIGALSSESLEESVCLPTKEARATYHEHSGVWIGSSVRSFVCCICICTYSSIFCEDIGTGQVCLGVAGICLPKKTPRRVILDSEVSGRK
jgi:hypothetical protein